MKIQIIKNKNKGFTLIEVVVVLAILAILATISVAGISEYKSGAESASLEEEAEALYLATQRLMIEDFQNDDANIIPVEVIGTVNPIDLTSDSATAEAILKKAGLTGLAKGTIITITRASDTSVHIKTFVYQDAAGENTVVIEPTVGEDIDKRDPIQEYRVDIYNELILSLVKKYEDGTFDRMEAIDDFYSLNGNSYDKVTDEEKEKMGILHVTDDIYWKPYIRIPNASGDPINIFYATTGSTGGYNSHGYWRAYAVEVGRNVYVPQNPSTKYIGIESLYTGFESEDALKSYLVDTLNFKEIY